MKGVRPYTFFMHTDTRKRSKKVYIKSLKKYLHFKMFWCMIIIDERYYVNQNNSNLLSKLITRDVQGLYRKARRPVTDFGLLYKITT